LGDAKAGVEKARYESSLESDSALLKNKRQRRPARRLIVSDDSSDEAEDSVSVKTQPKRPRSEGIAIFQLTESILSVDAKT